MHEITGYLKLA